MYCPKCSQQQISEDTRFCSRCGFQLDGVKTLLVENQNSLAVVPEAALQTQRSVICKRDVLLGATVMTIGAVAIALLMVSAFAATPWQALVIPLLMLWAALASVILLSGHAVREVRKLFHKDAAATSTTQAASDLVTKVNATPRHQALPHTHNAPVAGFGMWSVNTAELAQQPSVTEHTTNLLDKK